MKPALVLNIKTGTVIGSLMGFAVNESGIKYAVVRPKSRALDLVLEVNREFNLKYEVRP